MNDGFGWFFPYTIQANSVQGQEVVGFGKKLALNSSCTSPYSC